MDLDKITQQNVGNLVSTVVNPNVKTVIRKPRNILRPEHFTSRKGIVALSDTIKATKFKGKGHELDDLKLLLFKSKHWAHRLFPALTFEDFIDKAEQVGTKRHVKNFLLKVRHNQPLNLDGENDLVHSDNEDENMDVDKLLNEQTNNERDTNKSFFDFDKLFKDHIEDMKKKDIEEQKLNDEQLKLQFVDDNFDIENDDDDFEQNIIDDQDFLAQIATKTKQEEE